MEAADWMGLLEATVEEIRDALEGFDRWAEAGDRSDQYALDQVADAGALSVLRDAGVRVLSEESGLSKGDSSEVVILDPVDGSTNAARRIPHYCASLCVVDSDGPAIGLVVNLATGERFDAVRGAGARRDGQVIEPTRCDDLSAAIVGIAGWPSEPLPVAQFRSFGACALDLSAVACGRLDGYVDPIAHHGVWDYAAGVLICREAGADVGEIEGRELFHLDHGRRLGPVAGSTQALRVSLAAAADGRPDSS